MLAVALLGFLLVIGAGACGVAALALARQRVALAADTAALAGAGRLLAGGDESAACARAAELAARSDARMVSCRAGGLDVEVEVAVPVPEWMRGAARFAGRADGSVRARARAGPPPGTVGSDG